MWRNHYNTVSWLVINSKFTQNNVYYHDDMLNNGNIVGEVWKDIGVPYIVIYKTIDN